jgi:uncharacterized SAM-binding protein YcdF (DUF218 family)
MTSGMYHFVVDLLEPHTFLTLLVGLALFRLWRKRRDPTRRLTSLLISLAALALISTPAVVHLAVLSLEGGLTPLAERPADVQAVVVFAAGVHGPDGPRVRHEMDEDTLDRCLEAVRLYRQGEPCLVVVCGGKADADDPGPSAAGLMAGFLNQLGVKESDLLRDERSRNTYENAVECAAILHAQGIRRVVLVVDAVDMFRAAACLRKQGIDVVPAPCHYRATTFRLSLFSFIPTPGAARGFQRVWHEWLGFAWYRLRGRI